MLKLNYILILIIVGQLFGINSNTFKPLVLIMVKVKRLCFKFLLF